MSTSARLLATGPLSALFDDGGLLYVRLGGREIVRRVYGAVRDPAWGTVPGIISDLAIEESPRRFVVRFASTHRAGDVGFRWRGQIEATTDRLTFDFDGEALSAFRSNRIGLCVLHPVEGLRGAPAEVETTEGHRVAASFPDEIHPRLPFSDLRALSWQPAPGVQATVRLEGDAFETEDQRQWGDASFKTYSRPLALPFPFDVAAGDRVRQRFELQLRGDLGTASPARTRAPVRVTVGPAGLSSLPRLGTTVAIDDPSHDEGDRARLRALPLTFARIAGVPARDDFAERLRSAADQAAALGWSVDVTAFLSAEPAPAELDRLATAIAALGSHVEGVTLAPLVGSGLAAPARAAARAALAQAGAAAQVGVAPRPYFAELNRNRSLVEDADFVAVPLDPQVHLSDDRTLVEHLPASIWIAETVRRFAPAHAPVDLLPVTLRSEVRPTVDDDERGVADARQGSTFLAGWTIGHLAAASRAGIRRAAYFRSRGPLGYVAPSGPYPVWHALADLGEFVRGAGAQLLELDTSDPLTVVGLALRRGAAHRLLLGNLSPDTCVVELAGVPVHARKRTLDAGTVGEAARQPDAFRARAPQPLDGSCLTLAPHAYARIDWEV